MPGVMPPTLRAWLPSRLALACFLMGTLNNLTFVVNNAVATTLLPGQVGLVYIINVCPELLVKGTAPCWWHWSGYNSKMIFAGVCFGANLLLVHSGLSVSTGWKLVGVALSDLGGGLGEASMLALSQSFEAPRICLSAWSSGTGAAGVIGYLLSMYALPLLGTAGRLTFAALLLAAFWSTYFILLPKPTRVDNWMAGPLLARGRGFCNAPSENGAQHTATASCAGDGESNDATVCERREVDPSTSSLGGAAEHDAISSAEHDTVAAAYAAAGLARPLTAPEKLAMLARLVPFVLPIVLVYWAEYAMQSGAWTAFALGGAITSAHARERAYQLLNLFYQVGVLISRSAGRLFTLSMCMLWVAAWAQVGMLVLFVADGAAQLWRGPSLVLPALVVGLLGGTNYIQTMLAIDRCLPQRMREVALATISVGSPVGILLADATGLLLQWCLFRYHHIIISQGGWCPLVPAQNASVHTTHVRREQ